MLLLHHCKCQFLFSKKPICYSPLKETNKEFKVVAIHARNLERVTSYGKTSVGVFGRLRENAENWHDGPKARQANF